MLKKYIFVLTCFSLMSGCASSSDLGRLHSVPEIRPGILEGYLRSEEYPNSLKLVPPPPAEASAALALDKEVSQRSLELIGTARWALAAEDANFVFPRAAGTFSCSLNAPITKQNTPHLYRLLRRTIADAGLATYTAKNHYSRLRPFVVNKQPTCTPEIESHLIKDGSYPSGHTAAGWAWALILSEIAPEYAEAILMRGRAFGQSRVICNVHWQSDVIEGRFVGAAAVAKLHANSGFKAAIEKARVELEDVWSKNEKPSRDCDAEAEALSLDPTAPWRVDK